MTWAKLCQIKHMSIKSRWCRHLLSSKSTPTEMLVFERGQTAPRLMMGALGFKFHSSPPLKSWAVWAGARGNSNPSLKKTKRKDPITGKLFCAAMETKDLPQKESWTPSVDDTKPITRKHMETHTEHANTHIQSYINDCKGSFIRWGVNISWVSELNLGCSFGVTSNVW